MLTQLNGHNVVTTAVGADGGDIPTLSALNDLGGGDMSTAVYCTGDPDNVDTVDHALFADDANALSGHTESYFATADDLTGVAQRVGVLEGERKYVNGDTITLENICCAGVVDNSKRRVRFTIPLDKPVDTSGGTHATVSSSGDIYVYGGASQTVIYSGPLSGLGLTGGAATSGHMVTYSATRVTDYGTINGCPVTVYGTFVITVTDIY
jgi:hypothetical protein